MTDILVTIPRDRWQGFYLARRDGGEDAFPIYGERPPLAAGDYLYFVSHRRLRCALDVTAIESARGGHVVRGIFRAGLTVAGTIEGFRGWQRAPFKRADLLAFADWRREGVTKFAPRFSHLGDPPPPLAPYAHGKTPAEQGGSSA